MSHYFGNTAMLSGSSPVLDQAQSQLNSARMSHAEIQQELQSLMQYRAMTPMSVVEGQQRDGEMLQLRVRLRQMEDEMNGLRDTIARQQATIRNQSVAISNPRQYYPAPKDNTPQDRMQGHMANRQGPPTVRSTTHQTMYHPHGPSSANLFGSPAARPSNNTGKTPQGVQRTPFNPPSARGGGQGTPGSATQHPDNHMALVPVSAVTSTATTVKGQIARVFDMVEMFSWAHVNFPSSHGDNQLNKSLKERFLQAAAPTQAFPLMTSPATRYLLVAKVINAWILDKVLRADSFRGFNANIDSMIDAAKNQVYQSTPAQVKFQLFNKIAAQMRELRQNVQFKRFVDKLTQDRGNELWELMAPLMHTKTSRDWDDMATLMEEAHRLAIMMFSGTDQYRFEVKEGGSFFKKAAMAVVSRQTLPDGTTTPDQLEARGARVKLGVSPQVVVKNSTPMGLINERTVVPAKVLVDLTFR
ncbi:hypothetical protein PV08_03267 [Exophiala spinifera]|uniref:Uncharacterized protein n=1 Tax=Exophiala spinifera TaxID=91928 RepID=A0A0D2BJA5_9EURO|nr:uncharacterized protein PV08_03267 [Exophiala spinifera]KIW18978.1 hypothetical protein PV08_03267 [Exophiala spinifera]